PRTSLAEDGLVTFGQLADEAVCVRGPGGHLDLLGRVSLGGTVGDIMAHRVVEEHRILADDAGERAERFERDLAGVDAVEEDAAAVRLVEARDEVDERALAGAARANERDDASLLCREAHVIEHWLVL